MGFFSKLFKKKKKDDAPKAAGAKEPAAAPVAKEEPLPTEPVPRAIALARKANNDNVAAFRIRKRTLYGLVPVGLRADPSGV